MGYQALLFCPDEKTARTVTHVLCELDFAVERCTEPFAVVKKLMMQHFDAVVVDCDNEQNATLLFKSARNSSENQSSLAVAVVEGQAGVATAFRIGANLVLTKPINVEQAKGTLRVARGLLRKSAEASKRAIPSALSATSGPQTAPGASPSTPARGATGIPAGAVWVKPSTSPSPSQKLAPSAPTMPSMAASPNSMRSQERDCLDTPNADEVDVLEVPPVPMAKPATPKTVSPATAMPKFPWRPAPKPTPGLLATAPWRPTETANKFDDSETAPPTTEAKERASRVSPSQSTATAVAPAKEKLAAVAKALEVLTPSLSEPESKPRELEGQEKRSVSALSSHEPAPPTFFPGAYDPDEAEGGSKIKALIIVAAVVLLALSAGYLSWRNMHAQSAQQPTTTMPNTTLAPAGAPPTQNSKPSAVVPGPVSELTIGSAGGEGLNRATKAANAPKSASKQQSDDPDPAAQPAEPEVTHPLIVKNETRQSASAAPLEQQEPMQAPSAIGVGGATDPNALANINSTQVNVAKPSAQVAKVSQGVMEGLVLKRVAPHYPAQALQMRIQGAVELQATISKDGTITNLKAISGDGVLARAALEAVKQWKYKPYYLNGEPVEIQTQILVNFKLPN